MTTQEPSANGTAPDPPTLAPARGRSRHVPQRTCVACRETGPKRGFVRLVRTLDGVIEVDPTGRKAGRGAYLHAEPDCWEAALKKDRIAHSLKTTLKTENRAALRAYAEGLAERE